MTETEPISAVPAADGEPGAAILLVDDENGILSALRRLLRPHGYRLFIATSGEEAMRVLSAAPVDLVISDMRMPGMDGAQLLEGIRKAWPETVRILLTGYADMNATIDAINRGAIHRYIAKPWNDRELVLTIRQALERQGLERERERLQRLTAQQNRELEALNQSLDAKVRAQTHSLRQAFAQLEQAHGDLKRNFVTSVQIFTDLIEMREGMAGHSRRVADLARRIALALGLDETDVQDIFLAGLLHDIGKISLPDRLLRRPFGLLSSDDRAQVVKHAATGQALLMGLPALQAPARLIRHHHERFDGMGFPDGLSGIAIPLGARILALANDFDALQLGMIMNRQLPQREAVDFIRASSGKRYDPDIVGAFLAVVGHVEKTGGPQPGEVEIPLSAAVPGMALVRDILTPEGVLLLSRGHVLDDKLIKQLRSYERMSGQGMILHVCAGRRSK